MNKAEFLKQLQWMPAFPSQERDGQGNPRSDHQYGMTVRQFYKGMALAGVLGNSEVSFGSPQDAAYECARLADAMIAEDAEQYEGDKT